MAAPTARSQGSRPAEAVTAAATLDSAPTIAPSVEPPATVALVYLQALQAQQYPRMWQLLHPLAQARWPSEQVFAAFLKAKFASTGMSAIAAVTTGDTTPISRWDDARFTSQPLDATQVAATLRLAATAPYATPPTAMADSAPMVLVRNGNAWKVVDGGPADVQGPVLVPSHPVLRRLRVPIMMYHHVAPTPQRTSQMGNFDYRLAVDLTVTPADFAAQLAWLTTHGYQTITLPQLMAALYDDVALPAKPIILSFDDGYQDNAQYAAPALFQRHMVGAFNVVTGLVGSTHGPLQYMTWDQIGALAAEGMSIESHTVFHRDLGTLSDLEAQTELVDSRQMIAQHLGEAPQFICYPSGEPFRSGSAAAQQRILRFVQQDGYVGGLLDPTVAGAVQSSAAPEELTRIRVAGQEPLSQFAASIVDQVGP